MPGCSTGRNIQKFKGSGASTLQDALENGNTATIDIVLDNAVFHGDGGGLSNISGVGGSVGNLQQVTTAGGTASNKITLTNTNVSLETSGNVTVGNNKFFLGDGGLLSNTAGIATLQQAVTQGNVTTLTTSFTNTAESITTTGNVIVGTNVHATEFVGDGSSLTSLSAGNITTGELAIARGGTGASTLNNLITMGTHTTGDFVGTITGGDGIASTAGTSGEDTDHTLSVDTKADGGLVFESNKLAVNLQASSITGTLAVGDGGTGATTLNNLITMGTHTTGNFVGTITGGNGIASTGATSGENIAHTLSVDTTTNGGLVFDGSNKLKVDVGASAITGTLAIGDGGTGQTSASAAASALGLGTEDSPEFTGISLGSTAITESSGTVSIGGNAIRTGDVALGSQTSGNYVKTVTAGDGLDMSGSAGEGSEHTLSLDLKANHGLAIDSTELKIDLKTNGGLEFDSGKLGVKLDDTSISGTLPASKGGTGLTGNDLVHGRIIFANSSNTFTALPVDPTGTKYLKSAGADANPVWTSVSEEASPTPGSLTAGNGLASSSGTFNGSGDRTFSVDLLTDGGIVFDSGSDNAKKLLVNLGASSITGQVSKLRGGTGATEVTGTPGNNVLSVSPTLTGTTSVTNISASGNIVGVIAGSNTISGDTITASSKLVGHVNETDTSKNVFGKIISASTASGSKLTGQLNEASTSNAVYGGTITATSTISGTTITASTSLVGPMVGTISGSNAISGSTITASTNLVGPMVGTISGSNTISGSTITASTSLVGPMVGTISGSNTISGSTITATNLVGPGSGISTLNASNVSSGVIHKNRYTTSDPNDNSIFFYDTAIDELNALPPSESGGLYLKSDGDNSGALSWDTVTATISISDDNTNADRDLLFTTGSDLRKDTSNHIKYNPSSSTLKIIDSNDKSNTLTSLTWSGNAASADILSTARKIGNVAFNGSSDIIPNTIEISDTNSSDELLIPFSNALVNSGTVDIKLHSDASVLLYQPSTGTLKSTKFNGDGSDLTGVTASAVTAEATNTISIGTQNAAAPSWQNSTEN